MAVLLIILTILLCTIWFCRAVIRAINETNGIIPLDLDELKTFEVEPVSFTSEGGIVEKFHLGRCNVGNFSLLSKLLTSLGPLVSWLAENPMAPDKLFVLVKRIWESKRTSILDAEHIIAKDRLSLIIAGAVSMLRAVEVLVPNRAERVVVELLGAGDWQRLADVDADVDGHRALLVDSRRTRQCQMNGPSRSG